MRRLIVSLISFLITTVANAQISLQSGSATYNIPIFNWQDYLSNIGFSVNLSYNSGQGLRTDDIASNVGQGWNIYAGGFVQRMQVGLPDDQYPFNGLHGGGLGDNTKYPSGYLFLDSYQNPANGCPENLAKYPIFQRKNRVYKNPISFESDRELDYFSFQFNGRTGTFVLDKATQQGVMLGDSRIKISYQLSDMTASGIRTRISSFKIIDENGTIYNFTALALSRTLRTRTFKGRVTGITLSLSGPQFQRSKISNQRGVIDNSIINPFVVDGWYLTSIVDGFNARQTTFNYTNSVLNEFYSGSSISYMAEQDNVTLSHRYSYTSTPRIQSIQAPDGHRVDFIYKSEQRADLPNENALSHIDVTLNTRYVSRHSFITNYLIKNGFAVKPPNETERQNARLYLNSLVKYSVDLAASDEPYYFDYYTGSTNPGDIVPPPFTLVRDIWGYYNGDNSRDFFNNSINVNNKTYPGYTGLDFNDLKGLCYIRDGSPNTTPVLNPKDGYAKNGLIKTITTPSGGSIEYQYEQNETMLGSTKIMCGGVHVSQIKMFDKKNCTTTVPLITNYDYLTEGGDPSLWGFEQPINKFNSSYFYEPEKRIYRWRPWKVFGECVYRFQYPGIQVTEEIDKASVVAGVIQEVFSILTGGLSTFLLVKDIISVISKASATTVVGLVVTVVLSVVLVLITCLKPHSDYIQESDTIIFINADMNGGNLLPQQFKRVVVTPGDGTINNGRTVYTFTSDDDYSIWETSNTIYSNKQRYAYWAYGLPLKTTVFNGANMKVKETINTYSFTHAKRSLNVGSSTAYTSCRCVVKKSRSKRNDWFESDPLTYFTSSNSNISVEFYEIFTGRVELSSTKEIDFYNSDNIETVTTYSYNGSNYQPNHIEKQKSDESEISYEDITYSCDYNTGIFNDLNTKNAVNLPVKKVVSVGKKTSPAATTYTKYILGEKVTEYDALTDGSIKPYRVLVKRTNEPVLASSWVGYTSPTAALPATFKVAQTFSYNSIGNLVGVSDEGSRKITNIYDYNNRFAVATVVNGGHYSYSSYSSFETSELGGWQIESGSPAYFNSGVTGKRSFHLNGTNTLRTMTYGGKCLLSFWSTSSNVVITGASDLTLVKSAPTINGYTYYEYEFSGSESIDISGNAKIDELRLYPANARMKTQTFDELLGKTSECDENNRLTYYEYDEYGRMLFVKDDYKNIVKMYEYNQKKGFGECYSSATFSNIEIKATFFSENCPDDYYPVSSHTYTVPAGTYTSHISQFDADLKAWDEISRLGQAAANSSGADCAPYYYNVQVSRDFTPDNCELGYKPSPATITYVVPARTYRSTVSQADADAMAEEDVDLNGQMYADMNATCIISTDPEWEADEPAEERCGTGPLAGHKEVKMYDINPNSPTFNTFQWVDMGEDPACAGSGRILNHKTKKTAGQYIGLKPKELIRKPTAQIKNKKQQSLVRIQSNDIGTKRNSVTSVTSR